MKCLVVNGSNYFKPFKFLGFGLETDPSILDTNPAEVGLLVLTGGEDVSPTIYGHRNYMSFCSESRDSQEVDIFKKAVEHNIPIVGICRGAQLICALAGGKLIQDIDGHNNSHKLVFRDENGCLDISPEKVTSSHHQMQYPWTIPSEDFEVLAWSPGALSSHYLFDGENISSNKAGRRFTMEPDVVYYSKVNALGIQFHPEWMSEDSWGFKYTERLVKEKLFKPVEV